MEYVRYIQALIEEQKALGAVEEEVVSRLLLSGKSFSDDKNKAETLLQDFSLFCYFACWKKKLVT